MPTGKKMKEEVTESTGSTRCAKYTGHNWCFKHQSGTDKCPDFTKDTGKKIEMNKPREEILELTKLWYEYVSKDHHKDHDCHWYITEDWQYGEQPVYQAHHDGYIYDGEFIECGSYDQALKALIRIIKNAFEKEAEWAKQIIEKPDDWDEYQIEKTKFLQDNGFIKESK